MTRAPKSPSEPDGSSQRPETLPVFVTRAKDGGWDLLVRVQPGAKKSEFAGLIDGRLRIRLAAPAVENKANRELLSFLAKALGVRPAKTALLSGETGRRKRVRVAKDCEPDWNELLRQCESEP